jgi:outer membrane protein OmpA-like peptidoglycan-associated protein
MLNKYCFLFLILISSHFCFSQNQGDFGKKIADLGNLKGSIYFIEETTENMPADLEKRKPVGAIYTSRLDIPVREFSQGFPGVTNRFEYFGIIYKGVFEIENDGNYTWRLSSDDGSILWIDNKEIINNDGVHGTQETEGEVFLNKGNHTIKVWYFQGPAYEISLQLFIKMPGSEDFEIFDLRKMNKKLLEASKKIEIKTDSTGIRLNLPAGILFDTGKSVLKPEAQESIKAAFQILTMYPDSKLIVEGHSDNTGNENDNITLSKNRAKAVLDALTARNLPKNMTAEIKGYGSGRPVRKGNSPEDLALNRRVEILIIP